MNSFLIGKKIKLITLTLLVSITCFSQVKTGIYDAFDYGAKGNGYTNDTRAIQGAIDSCHLAGGGEVYLHNGCFLSGTVYLKSNVTLHVEAGAVLRGSDKLDDFPTTPSKYPSYTGEFVSNKALIYAEDAQNISICGRGMMVQGLKGLLFQVSLPGILKGRPFLSAWVVAIDLTGKMQ